MKKLMLVVALAGGACGSDDVPIDTTTSTTAPEGTTTTAAPATTTTEPVPEPTTTVAPYVAPATTRAPRAAATTVYEPPAPQGRSTRGDTPPEYVKQCESGGDYQAVNPNGHYGAWQFSIATWRSVGGTGRPDHASPAEQDYRAAILWNGGRGASHWSCA